MLTDPFILKQCCLLGTFYCLWKAFHIWCVNWYRSKVDQGVQKVHSYLSNLKQSVLDCIDYNQLTDVVLKLPSKLTYNITVTIGNDGEIDYEYVYNIDKRLESIRVILNHPTNVNHDQFVELKNQLIVDIDNALDVLQKEGH